MIKAFEPTPPVKFDEEIEAEKKSREIILKKRLQMKRGQRKFHTL